MTMAMLPLLSALARRLAPLLEEARPKDPELEALPGAQQGTGEQLRAGQLEAQQTLQHAGRAAAADGWSNPASLSSRCCSAGLRHR